MRRNVKTKLASKLTPKGFKALDLPIHKQIEQIMADQARLIHRTQLKRTAYTVLGKVAPAKIPEKSAGLGSLTFLYSF